MRLAYAKCSPRRGTGGHAVAHGVPPLLQHVLDAGRNTFPRRPGAAARAPTCCPAHAREQRPHREKNAGASLADLGDGMFCVEFHSKMNAIGGDTVQMLQAGLKEASRNGQALVIGNDAPNFSAGANLMLVLLEAQEGNWDDIDLMIRTFQQSTHGAALQRCPGRRGSGGADAGRRRRDRAARRPRPGSGRNLHGTGRSRRRA